MNSDEYQYLDLLRRCANGDVKGSRTGIPTRSLYGEFLRFRLSNFQDIKNPDFELSRILPALTTKSVNLDAVFKELFWIISGNTDSEILNQQKVYIWDANGSREFLDKSGFPDRQIGDLGPVYGFQWRHFGAEYIDSKTDYSGKGIDQLAGIVNTLRKNPMSRRMLLNSWNPGDLNKMVLPPCHYAMQINCVPIPDSGKFYMDLLVDQRSADVPIGLPFNIASYGTLAHILSDITGPHIIPRHLIFMIGDAHIYQNQLHLVASQLIRTPYPFPKLRIVHKTKPELINEYSLEMLQVENYKHHPFIKYDFAV